MPAHKLPVLFDVQKLKDCIPPTIELKTEQFRKRIAEITATKIFWTGCGQKLTRGSTSDNAKHRIDEPSGVHMANKQAKQSGVRSGNGRHSCIDRNSISATGGQMKGVVCCFLARLNPLASSSSYRGLFAI